MDFSKIIYEEAAHKDERFLTVGKPDSVIQSISGNGSVTYNDKFQRFERCVIKSGESSGSSAEVSFPDLQFAYGTDENYYHFFVVTFHGVTITYGNNININSDAQNGRWEIGLKYLDSGAYYIAPKKSTKHRANINYLKKDGTKGNIGPWAILPNMKLDISIPIKVGSSDARIWCDGATLLRRVDVNEYTGMSNAGVQGKKLVPYIKVLNAGDAYCNIAFDGVSVDAWACDYYKDAYNVLR